MDYALVWVANWFSPRSPFETDDCSLLARMQTAGRYHELKGEGNHVSFLLVNSIVRDPSGTVALRDTMHSEIRDEGIPEADIVLLPQETTGSPTDGLALARYARAHPDTMVEIYATTPAAAKHLKTMYKAVAYYLLPSTLPLQEGYRFPFYITDTVVPRCAGVKLDLACVALRTVTRIVAMSRWTFMRWYNFLNRMYQRRVEGRDLIAR